MSVSAIIISFNSAGCLPACLESLRPAGVELIVVDNASSDGSVAVARRAGAQVIANADNRGFAGAANQGANAAAGEFLLFLNPDVELLEGLDRMLCALQADPSAAACGGLLVDAAGQPQRGFTVRALPSFLALAFEVLLINRLWPGNPVNRRYRCLDLPLDRAGVIEQPPGGCLLVRRTALEKIGGWDEAFYPVWFEDVDLCLRFRGAGFRILFEPAARWRHLGGHSIGSLSFADRQLFWYRNLVRYVHKNFRFPAAPAIRILVCAGATVRLLLSFVAPGGQRSWRAYWAAIRESLAGVFR